MSAGLCYRIATSAGNPRPEGLSSTALPEVSAAVPYCRPDPARVVKQWIPLREMAIVWQEAEYQFGIA